MPITQDASDPLVVVVGATGVQGGSVVKALSESDKPYRIKGFTRDPSQPTAQALAKQGVDLVTVSPTVENKDLVRKEFEGADVAFVVTTYRPHFSTEKEVSEGKMMVEAAHEAKVKLLIWSGLESCAEHSKGKYKYVAHFDGKKEITRHAQSLGVNFVNIEAAVYMTNHMAVSAPKKQADGSYVMFGPQAPESVQPLVDAGNDFGLWVRRAIESPLPSGSELYAYGEVISMNDCVKQLGEITGKNVSYTQITEQQFIERAGFPSEALKREFLQMFLSIGEFGYYGDKEIASSLEGLARKPRTWAEFVKATDWSRVLN